ncbi:MAG: alginate lyase family protein [Candidatus Riflebacteria bacterium]|nr:alginate lyase family protein [Candidatus Riflebacteria bacterium]
MLPFMEKLRSTQPDRKNYFELIQRYLYSLAPLKPVQIYGRLLHLLRRRFIACGPFDLLGKRAARLRESFLPTSKKFSFTFLNLSQSYNADEMNWNDRTKEKLWRYHLHYFDLLTEGEVLDPADQAFLILDWVAKNPDDRAESWEPYVIARRACRWIPWLELHAHDFPGVAEIATESLFHQGRRLRLDVEEHLQANHLFADLKALLLLSGFFARLTSRDGNEAWKHASRRWRSFAVRCLLEELDSQFLTDGAHEERSPMYHLAMMNDIADIILECRRWKLSNPISQMLELQGKCLALLPRMRVWLEAMTHPDGRFALFQDAAFNGFPGCGRPRPMGFMDDHHLFEASGYFIARRKAGSGGNMDAHPLKSSETGRNVDSRSDEVCARPEHYLAVDVGEPGPSHQVGHAHAGMLSFELSLWGRRAVVDTGCGSYQNRNIRAACRGTSGHNIPAIDGCEQSDIWGEFRMGRRVRLLSRSVSRNGQMLSCIIEDVTGNRFERNMSFGMEELAVTDRLIKRAAFGAFHTLLHLAPEARPTHLRSGRVVRTAPSGHCEGSGASIPGGSLLIGFAGHCFRLETKQSIELLDSCYYPEFGLALPNKTIRLNPNANEEEIAYVLRFPG